MRLDLTTAVVIGSRSMRLAVLRGVLVAVGIVASGLPKPSLAQDVPEIEGLAASTAQRIAQGSKGPVIVAGLSGCLLDTKLCTAFEATLHTALEKGVPGVRFISGDELATLLNSYGFLRIDGYSVESLRVLASKVNAILVTESMRWQPDGYEMTAAVDVAGEISSYTSKVPGSHGSDNEPLVFKDSESGVSFVIPRGNKAPSFQYPRCEKCPVPKYPTEARARHLEGTMRLLVTITERGFAEHVSVIKSFDDGLTSAAVETVRSWRFKPALGPDGKPFAMRTGVDVAFRLRR